MCPTLTSLSIDGNPLTQNMAPQELRNEIQRIVPHLKYLDDVPLGKGSGGPSGGLSMTSHRLLGNTGSLLSEMQAVSLSLKDTVSGVDRSSAIIRPSSAASDRSVSPGPGAAPDHSSDLTHGTILCGPPSKQLRRKVTRDTMESIEMGDLDWQTAPPKPVGAWAEEPNEMLAEWKDSREWLTRELTIDSLHEEKTQAEKQANYEAALRELSRPTTAQRRLSSRPPSSTSSSRLSHHFDEAVEATADRKEGKRGDSGGRRSAERVSSGRSEGREGERRTRRDSVERRDRTERRESVERRTERIESVERRTERRESVERRTEKSRDSSSTRRSSKRESSTERGKHISSRRSGSKERASLEGTTDQGVFSGKGKYRVVTVDKDQVTKSLDTGLKPVRPQIGRSPDGSGGMSTRFRKIRASIEDTVMQQSTIDRLYSDRMPKPGLPRHVSTRPGPV
eukprot:sb/3464610/